MGDARSANKSSQSPPAKTKDLDDAPTCLTSQPSPTLTAPVKRQRRHSHESTAIPNSPETPLSKDSCSVGPRSAADVEHVEESPRARKRLSKRRSLLKAYALPRREEGEDGAPLRKEERAWVEVYSMKRPVFTDDAAVFDECAAMFCDLCPDFKDRCLPPSGDFARQQLSDWAELPYDMSNVAELKKKGNKMGSVSLVEALTERLESLPHLLTKEALDLHTEIIDIISTSTTILDGARSTTSIASSVTTSYSEPSSDGSSDPPDPLSALPAAPPSGEQFASTALAPPGSQLDPLLPIEPMCMLNEGRTFKTIDGVTEGFMTHAHVLPQRPTKAHLFYVLKMYYILVSGAVSKNYRNNDVSNLFYLDLNWHGQFEYNNLLIVPDIDFLRALLAFLDKMSGSFDAEAFFRTLPAQLQPDKLTFRVIGLKRNGTVPGLLVEGNGKYQPYAIGPNGLFYNPRDENDLLPPRTFFRSTGPDGKSTAVNPILFIINATHKLVKQPVSKWPDGHEEAFLAILNIYMRIFRQVKHDPTLYNLAIRTAGYRTARCLHRNM
ncbi:hypothetical protein JCM11251_002722 [Rhodosporidiobolus azoricus]